MKQCMTPVDDYILDVRPTNELEFMIGPTTGAPTTFLATAIQPTPAWLLLSGPTITGWVSADGTSWTLVRADDASDLQRCDGGTGRVHSVSASLNTVTFEVSVGQMLPNP